MKRRLLIVLIALLLCASVSYSWILDSSQDPAGRLILDYNGVERGKQLNVIAESGFSIQILKYVDANTTVVVDSSHPLSLEAMVPGESLRFIIRLRNTNSNTGVVKLFMSGITCQYNGHNSGVDADDILDSLYLSVIPGTGYYNSYNMNLSMPAMIYSKVSELSVSQSENSVLLYRNLQVPHTPLETDYVDLECRIWLDAEAEGLMDISFNIGKFVLSL